MVARGPGSTGRRNRNRRVVDDGRCREQRAPVHRPQGGRVHEGLEGGPRLPARHDRPVELAHLIVPAADEGPDLTGTGVERDERRLESRRGIRPAEAGHRGFESIEPARHRILGEALKRGVEGGEDPCPLLAADRLIVESLLQLLPHVVGEVRSGLAGRRLREGANRLAARPVVFAIAQHAQLAHLREDGIAPLARPRRIQGGRMRVGRADHAGQERGLARGELMDPLAEVRAGGGAHAPDGERPALTEIDLVQVRLEDLVLGIAAFHQQGQPGFLRLAQHRPPRGQEAALDELLGKRASALRDSSRAQIRPGGAHETAEVEGAVLEKPLVFGGEDGIDEGAWGIGQPHGAVILTRSVDTAREHLAFERRGDDIPAVTRDARDAIALYREADPGTPGNVGAFLAEEHDIPGTGGTAELSRRGRRRTRLGVSQARERTGEIDEPDVEAGEEGLPGRVHERRAPDFGPGEPSQFARRVGTRLQRP